MITLVEDTRQKIGKHDTKHNSFNELGVGVVRCALPVGDYIKFPTISVDTKENMLEVAADIVGDHERFRNECIRADNYGCHLYILVENSDGIASVDDVHNWNNPRLEYSKKAVTGIRLEKSMKTMSNKYGVRFMFCKPSESAEMVLNILDGRYE